MPRRFGLLEERRRLVGGHGLLEIVSISSSSSIHQCGKKAVERSFRIDDDRSAAVALGLADQLNHAGDGGARLSSRWMARAGRRRQSGYGSWLDLLGAAADNVAMDVRIGRAFRAASSTRLEDPSPSATRGADCAPP